MIAAPVKTNVGERMIEKSSGKENTLTSWITKDDPLGQLLSLGKFKQVLKKEDEALEFDLNGQGPLSSRRA